MMKKYFRRSSPVFKMLTLGMIAGLLIWAKLRLVTSFPRTVKADPVEREVQEQNAEPSTAENGVLEKPQTTSSRGESSPPDRND